MGLSPAISIRLQRSRRRSCRSIHLSKPSDAAPNAGRPAKPCVSLAIAQGFFIECEPCCHEKPNRHPNHSRGRLHHPATGGGRVFGTRCAGHHRVTCPRRLRRNGGLRSLCGAFAGWGNERAYSGGVHETHAGRPGQWHPPRLSVAAEGRCGDFCRGIPRRDPPGRVFLPKIWHPKAAAYRI